MRALLLVLLLSSCSYTLPHPVTGELWATCHDGMFQAFCVVATPPGTSVVGGAPIMASTGQLMQGAGLLAR